MRRPVSQISVNRFLRAATNDSMDTPRSLYLHSCLTQWTDSGMYGDGFKYKGFCVFTKVKLAYKEHNSRTP